MRERDLRAGDDAQAPRPARWRHAAASTTRPSAASAASRRSWTPRSPTRSSASSAAAAAATSCSRSSAAAAGPTSVGRHQPYLKDAHRLDISAKDFRTWGATVLAAIALVGRRRGAPARRRREADVSRAVQEVAYYLGNTPAVARASYIDPRVFDRFRDGRRSPPASWPPTAAPPSRAPSRRRCWRCSRARRRRGGEGIHGLVAGRADREDLVQPGDLERLGDVRVGVHDRQHAVLGVQALDGADEDAEGGRVEERRLREVHDDPGVARLEASASVDFSSGAVKRSISPVTATTWRSASIGSCSRETPVACLPLLCRTHRRGVVPEGLTPSRRPSRRSKKSQTSTTFPSGSST